MSAPLTALFHAFHSRDRMLRFVPDFPQINWIVVHTAAEVAAHIGAVQIAVLNNRACSPEVGAALRANASSNLAWIHFVTAGIEKGIAMGLPAGVPVTNAAGANGPVLAEHAIGLLLASMRRFHDMFRAQDAQEWRRLLITPHMRGLEGARVCIIGLGAAGRQIARRLRAFDCDVIAISRGGSDENISRVYPREALRAALAISDVAIVCTNSDASSYHMLGEAEFAAMKRGGYVVNVARGEIIDERALIAALQSGHLAGAGLDVTEVEPLPAGDPLWTCPNVIIAPHIAGGGAGEGGYRRQKDLFAENLVRLQAGQPLLSLVDMSAVPAAASD